MKRTFVTNLSYLNSADLSSLEKLEKSDKIIVFSNEDDFGISLKQFSALSSTKAKIEFTEFVKTENSSMQTVFYLGTLIGSNTKDFIVLVGMEAGISDVLSGFSIQAEYAEDFNTAIKFEPEVKRKRRTTKSKDISQPDTKAKESRKNTDNEDDKGKSNQNKTTVVSEKESKALAEESEDEYISKEEYEQLKNELYILSGCHAQDYDLPEEVFIERLITDLVVTQRGNTSEYYVNTAKDFPKHAREIYQKTMNNLLVMQDMAEKIQKNRNKVV